ncbi:PDDEXK family nuclease [Aeromicrobium choanae]|uniref:DUF559 domain-containing protein n=1 Tax=Aeromicrobium choanae TaxID=1736691 RepID=A0A1T4YS68_9ACTN|nr:hypothetical protein [Aeromicrobium choanae]SKB04448.1 hypothetical protein SAMN06295964_0572 [Aeromicrobium choanae]
MDPSLHATAAAQEQVVSRRQLFAAGVTRATLRAQLSAGRWRSWGRHTICLHSGPLPQRAVWWRAVIEAGPRAMLDGVSALQAAGLTGIEVETVRVSVPRGARTPRISGVTVRQTRRLTRRDLVGPGLPRVRPDVAAVRAALWARSDRQAAFFLTASVQQRLCRAEDVARAALEIRRHARRRLLLDVSTQLVDGVRAIGELDFARLCREHGLPEPTRQSQRRTARGSAYLDVEWPEYDVVVEIDGVQHLSAPVMVDDALRQNHLVLHRSTVIRVPNLGLRVAPAEFLAQVREALVRGGWQAGPDVIRSGGAVDRSV